MPMIFEKDQQSTCLPDSPAQGASTRRSSLRSSPRVRMLAEYNAASEMQFAGAKLLAYHLKECAQRIVASTPQDINKPLTVAEYGCATGGSSIEPLKAILDALNTHSDEKQKPQKQEVLALMNDLPNNDWDVLDKTLKEAFAGNDASSTGEISFAFVKHNMYKPFDLVNQEQESSYQRKIDIAYSSYALHWVSEMPCLLPGSAIWPNQLVTTSSSETAAVHAAWDQSMTNQWKSFLDLRAKEMSQGAFLVLNFQAADPLNGRLSEGSAKVCQDVLQDMIDEKAVCDKQAKAITMPEYPRTLQQVLEPLVQESSSGNTAANTNWTVEFVQSSIQDCPITRPYKRGEITAEVTADRMVQNMRAFMEAPLLDSLTKACSSADEGNELMIAFWERCRAKLLAEGSEKGSANCWLSFIVLRRTECSC